MTGDGLRAPMNAPGGGLLVPGIQPGDEPVTIANRVYIVGPGGGMFVYNPTQAKNNLVETAGITGATHDKFGNTILPGDTLYMNQGGTYYALQIAGGAGSVPLVHWWVSPTDQTGTYTTLFVVGLTVSAGQNGIDLGSAAAFGVPPQCWSNPLLARDPVTPANGAETWRSLGTLANYTVNTGRFRMLASDSLVMLDLSVASAGANTAATTFSTTLPSPYFPLGNKTLPLKTSRTVVAGDVYPSVSISTAGAVTINNTAAVTSTLTGIVVYPVN